MVSVYMELMVASLDKVYSGLRERNIRIPNAVLVYITISVVNGTVWNVSSAAICLE